MSIVARSDRCKLCENDPVPSMRDALAYPYVRAVRFAHSKCRTYSRLRDTMQRWLNLFHIHIASQPSGCIRSLPIPNCLLMQLLRSGALCKRFRLLCPLTSGVKVLTGGGHCALRAKQCTGSNLLPTISADSVRFQLSDKWQSRTAFRFATMLLCERGGRTADDRHGSCSP